MSLRVHEEEILGLVGESGSGKSTVAYTVIGMYKPTSGNIVFRGRNIEKNFLRLLAIPTLKCCFHPFLLSAGRKKLLNRT
ncbi:MAG: ATP-binding cassette domain-containing protein, partial [Spirochaetes bacterium]|nr:ATP-binding cassette domain-containing protein [Spirochaetota bacterium]